MGLSQPHVHAHCSSQSERLMFQPRVHAHCSSQSERLMQRKAGPNQVAAILLWGKRNEALRRLCEAPGDSQVPKPALRDPAVKLQQWGWRTEAKVDSRPLREEIGDWEEMGTRSICEAIFRSLTWTSDWKTPLRVVEEGDLRAEGPRRTGQDCVKGVRWSEYYSQPCALPLAFLDIWVSWSAPGESIWWMIRTLTRMCLLETETVQTVRLHA